MPGPIAPTPATGRLRTLLEEAIFGVGDEVLAEARSLGPQEVGDVVASVIEAELTHPTASGAAIRAAHVARDLHLATALPALVRCVELLPDVHPLRRAALALVPRFGAAAVDGLVAAFDRSTTTDGRARVAEALARTTVEDDRIRAAFVRMLEDDPSNAARHLADHGDRRAVTDLARAADRLLRAPLDDCPVCAREHLKAILSAVHALGGRLSDEQLAGIDDVLERAEASWIPFEDPFAAPAVLHVPGTRCRRPGRNDPCPCGSGKKYKKCHLELDERGTRQ